MRIDVHREDRERDTEGSDSFAGNFSIGNASGNFGESDADLSGRDFEDFDADPTDNPKGADAGKGTKNLPASHPSHLIAEFEQRHGLTGL